MGAHRQQKGDALLGSHAAWPIGAQEADAFQCVAVVERGPDLLAARHFFLAESRQVDTAAVVMLGAANNIPGDAPLLLANNRVDVWQSARTQMYRIADSFCAQRQGNDLHASSAYAKLRGLLENSDLNGARESWSNPSVVIASWTRSSGPWASRSTTARVDRFSPAARRRKSVLRYPGSWLASHLPRGVKGLEPVMHLE